MRKGIYRVSVAATTVTGVVLALPVVGPFLIPLVAERTPIGMWFLELKADSPGWAAMCALAAAFLALLATTAVGFIYEDRARQKAMWKGRKH